MVIQPAVEMGKRVIFLAHARELIYQCRNKLADFGIQAGIIMAGEPYEPWRKVQVASKDTINARAFRSKSITLPDADIVFADECHRSLSPTWARVIKHYHKAVVIGLTATPARGDGRGMGELYTALVQACPTERLIQEGYLAPSQVYAPYRPDLSKVRTTAGEYNEGDLDRVMNKQEIVGNIVEHWISKAKGRPTIVFCTGIEHSIRTRDAFVQHGIRACHVDGETPKEERDELFSRFINGDFMVLTNCEVCSEGVDLPLTSCVVLARPTKSIVKYKQQCLDMQTEVLTKSGWKVTPDESEEVASWNPSNGEIEWCHPRNVFSRPLETGESMAFIKSMHTDIRVTDGHTMFYRHRHGTKNWMSKEASELCKHKNCWMLPVSGTEACSEAHISDDEIRFIGWFLTDGSYSTKKTQITIHQSEDSPYNSDIIQTLRGCGFHYTVYRQKRSGKWLGYADGINYSVPSGVKSKSKPGWKKLQKYLDKKLTYSINELSERQLAVLLEVINMGDGSKKCVPWHVKTYTITTGIKEFADNLQSLCVRRGYRCNISTVANRNHKPVHLIYIRKIDYTHIGGSETEEGRCKMAVTTVTEQEHVWCMSTKHGTLVSRRNGRVAILGNCGRGMRPYPGKEDLLILDHAGSVYAHGFPEEDVEWTLDSDIKVGDRVRQAMERGERKVPTVCKKCFLAYYKVGQCPNCGYKPPGHTRTKLKTKDGDLVKLEKGKSRTSLTKEDMQRYWTFCLYCCAAKNKTVGNAAGMFKSQFKLLPWTAGVQPMPRSGQWAMRVGDLFPKYNKAK